MDSVSIRNQDSVKSSCLRGVRALGLGSVSSLPTSADTRGRHIQSVCVVVSAGGGVTEGAVLSAVTVMMIALS